MGFSRIAIVVVVGLLISTPASAQEEDPSAPGASEPEGVAEVSAPAAAAAPVSLLAGTCKATANCTSVTACTFDDSNDVNAYACFAFKAKKECQTAITDAPDRPDDADKDIIIAYFKKRDGDDKSCVPSRLQAGSFRTALWTSTKKGAIQHGIQVLPSVGIGVPVKKFTSDNDAAKALQDVSAIAGASVRYTPLGFWVSAHAFLGTASVESGELDPAIYTKPKFLITGFGVDTLSGLVSVSLVHAALHQSSLFLDNGKSSVNFIQVSFDLTALGVLTAGAVND